MIADGDYNIIYLNRSSEHLFHDAREDFGTLIPQFNPDKILGKNIDFFHQNSAHQRNILEHLEKTYTKEMQIGNRVMVITANPIIDLDGERIGTVVEWTDRTAEVAIEREIDSMVEAASQGDFSTQLPLENKTGFFHNLTQGLNSLASNTDAALADMQRILGAMHAATLLNA